MWLDRMQLRGVWPNYQTYNMALVACLNGAVKSTYVAAKIATDMLEDTKTEITCGLKGSYDFCSMLPDLYTKVLARELMKHLREKWRSGDVDMALTKTPPRVPHISSEYHANSCTDRNEARNANAYEGRGLV